MRQARGTTGDVLRSVFPDGVRVSSWDELLAAGRDEAAAIENMWPAEAEASATYAPRRRAEYASVRDCAREALRREGIAPAAIVKGHRGAPMFPPDVVGAMTHTDGLRAAAIARQEQFRSLGVDAEPHEGLPPGVLDAVSLPPERDWVRAVLAGEPELRVDKLLFSAKEATYKAWFPLTRRWLGFEDAELTFDTDDVARTSAGIRARGTFASRILIAPDVIDGGAPLQMLNGRWAIDSGFVVAAIAVEQSATDRL